jgi:acetyl esterase/lipase
MTAAFQSSKATSKAGKKWLKRIGWALVFFTSVVLSLAGTIYWYYHPTIERINGVIYGQRNGQPLTMDILRPLNANGKAIAMMVSGGWRSNKPGEVPAWLLAPVLRRGYTVFAVCHISQPESSIPEIIQDVQRGIRFIRLHSAEYKIDPQSIGVTGGSAGGHLSLMLATRGDLGDSAADEPIDRQSCQVQAVAIFYPVTDLLNLGDSTENLHDGGPPKSFKQSFGSEANDPEKWKQIGRECSPIYYLDRTLPPTLIYHGDADTLVPLDQSQRYAAEAKAQGGTIELVVHPGGQHGWPTMVLDIHHFARWFDQHLQ